MKSILETIDSLGKRKALKRLFIVGVLLIMVFLLSLTWPIWTYIYRTIITILRPFILGFGFAYLIRPAVVFFERHKIKRGISVPLILIAVGFGFAYLFANLLPMVINDLSSLFATFGDGVEAIFQIYLDNINEVPSPIIKNIVDQLIKMSDNLFTSIPNIPLLLGDSINTLIGWLTTTLFSFVIGLYCVMDYERIAESVSTIFSKISIKLESSRIVVNEAVRTYLNTLIVVMAITFVEYSLFYYLVGHKYALIMGLLCAFGLLIPYVGSIAVNTLGFISGLGLGVDRVLLIFLGLMILPNIDSYVISPMVFKKRNQAKPLWSLFSFFACSVLFGFVGVLISTPLYFSVRAVLDLRRNNWSLETEK